MRYLYKLVLISTFCPKLYVLRVAAIFDATSTLSFNDGSKRRGCMTYDEVYLFLAFGVEVLRRVTHQEVRRKPAGKITPSATIAPISVALPSPCLSTPQSNSKSCTLDPLLITVTYYEYIISP